MAGYYCLGPWVGDTLIHDVFDVGAAVADLLAPVDRRQRTNTADDGR